jgi:hypothetical protein
MHKLPIQGTAPSQPLITCTRRFTPEKWRKSSLAEIMRKHSPGDPSFAHDLEEAQRSQGPAEFPEWPN